jgi:ketosteroid isomerase-like protein
MTRRRAQDAREGATVTRKQRGWERTARRLGSPAVWLWLAVAVVVPAAALAQPLGPEQVIRAIVRANADRDLPGMARYMAKDADAVNYSIAGSKFVGWAAVERALAEEFQTVSRLELPIHELRVWAREDFAYFSMELDYVRYIGTGQNEVRTLLPLRETGVLERRRGQWILVAWHESTRTGEGMLQASADPGPATTAPGALNLGGRWTVQEKDRSYEATLDADGNGTYTWQGGEIRTTRLDGRTWQGTWHQPGNDREGGFEVVLSDDRTAGQGSWWYTRVDSRKVPPREWGGPYVWKRLGSAAR